MMDGNLRDEIVQQNIPVFIGMPVNMKHVMEKLRADEFEQIWIKYIDMSWLCNAVSKYKYTGFLVVS